MDFDLYLDSINYGYDGFIMKANFFNYLKNLNIIASVRDENGDGVNLEMNLINIKEGKFIQNYNPLFALLSDGIKYKRFDGVHFISFSLNDDNDEINDVAQFRQSYSYFACEDFSYSIEPFKAIYDA